MSKQQVASRYAKAVFELAKEKNKLTVLKRDFTLINQLLETNEEFIQFVQNPVISSRSKIQVLEKTFKGKVDLLTYQFLCFLEEKSRLINLKDICQKFLKLHLDNENIVIAKIFSRSGLSKNQISSICHHLKLKLRKEIEPQVTVKKEMIGGIKIQVDDQIYDYSIRTQLDKFKRSIIHA